MTPNAAWVKHPGFYIKEEMEARGWLQRDLAFILGVPEQAVNMILAGKRSISVDMAQALGLAFDVEPEFFANLQQRYDMAHAKDASPDVAVRRAFQATYPVREMIRRGWIAATDTAMLELQLQRFFCVKSSDEIPYLAHAAKKSKYEEREVPPPQLAWLFRVKHIARSISVQKFSEARLRAAVRDFGQSLEDVNLIREVPRVMAECGVRFMFVEKLPNAKIDGVCFWQDNESPVVAMSLQRDTIDNFWFVWRHECEHVLRGHGKDNEILDDLSGDKASSVSEQVSEDERIANAAASDFCAPAEKLNAFMIRKHPFYYEKDVVAFSRLHHRHVGIVVGQMQRRMNNYSYLTRHLAKIRSLALSGAISDGWEQVVPVSL